MNNEVIPETRCYFDVFGRYRGVGKPKPNDEVRSFRKVIRHFQRTVCFMRLSAPFDEQPSRHSENTRKMSKLSPGEPPGTNRACLLAAGWLCVFRTFWRYLVEGHEFMSSLSQASHSTATSGGG